MLELLRRFMAKYKAKTAIAVLTKVVEVGFEVLTPLVVARMIDAGVQTGNTDEVVRMGATLLVFALVSYSFTLVCQRLAAQVSQGVGTDVRDALYAHINRLSPSDLDSLTIPSLITRVTNDVNQMQLAVALLVRMGPRWPLLALGSMVAAIAIDMRLGIVFLVCMPLIGAVFALVMRASIPFFGRMQQKLDRVSRVTRESLSGMRVIRAFRQQDAQTQRSHEAIDEQTRIAVAIGRLSAILNPATFAIMNIGVAAILWAGGHRVNVGDLTTGQVMAFVSYMTQALVAVTVMANIVVVVMRGHASSLRILEVLEREPSMTDAGNAMVELTDDAATGIALELRDVSFAYEGAAVPALAGIGLKLPAGATLGVIGGTGSGKTTLSKLLPRLYDASSGSICVFGTDVRRYPFVQLRSLVSVVPQNVSLVSGTVRSNLIWRNPDATDQELWEALGTAQADDFVRSLQKGLDSPVEAGGVNFSGGQRQRLTIARALVGAPRIVVLDDAASALDYATDARLRAALRKNRDRLTSVIVSQRVAAVMGADKILVLDHGSPAGLGTHEDLLRTCGLYREIYESQMHGDGRGLDDGSVRSGEGV